MKPIESKRIVLDRKIVVRFPDFDGFVTECATNISMTGMFVRAKEPQAPGTPLSFELRLEDGAPLVRGSGWVVWARERRKGPDRPAGMGVEFSELDHKSRRLVRWLILNQLPEDQPEFDVHAGSANAPVTARTPRHPDSQSQEAAGRNRRAGIFTALALLALLAGLVLWRGFEPASGAPSLVAGRTGGPAPGPVPAIGARSDPVGMGRPDSGAEPTPGPPVVVGTRDPAGDAIEVAEAEALALVREWARSWSVQDVDAYLGHYATDFDPEGMTVAAWRSQRRERLTAPESIRVAVARLEARVSFEGEAEARVTFLQTYRSDGYADTVDKVLELVREGGVWKIRRESAD